jgi:dsDNA-specific endonuclease/ATPase MutS2
VRGSENLNDRYDRLYMQDKKKIEIIREMKAQEVYKDYTFQPKINKISKSIAQDSRQELMSENMSNPAAKQKFEQKKQKYL